MSESLEVMARDAGPLAVERQQPTVADMLQAVVTGGITSDKVEVVERLCAMKERMDAREAERQYAIALGAMQRECENVIALKDVDGKFCYAPLLDIWNAVRPAVERNKFTLQWSQEHQGDKIKVTLTLQHEGGHKRDFFETMRLGSNAPGTPAGAQAPVLDSQAETRAKRRLLMNALNIVVDATGAAEDVGNGAVATPQEAAALQSRLMNLCKDAETLGASERRFLETAGVKEWSQIPKVLLPILNRLMADKERAAARKGAA